MKSFVKIPCGRISDISFTSREGTDVCSRREQLYKSYRTLGIVSYPKLPLTTDVVSLQIAICTKFMGK